MSGCLRIEVSICRFAAIKRLGTSVLLLPIYLSSRTPRQLSLAIARSTLGSTPPSQLPLQQLYRKTPQLQGAQQQVTLSCPRRQPSIRKKEARSWKSILFLSPSELCCQELTGPVEGEEAGCQRSDGATVFPEAVSCPDSRQDREFRYLKLGRKGMFPGRENGHGIGPSTFYNRLEAFQVTLHQ